MRKLGCFVLGAAIALAPPAISQDVRNIYIGTASQIADGSITVAKLTGLGTGVATLLGGTSSGTVGLVGTTSPTLITPTLGVASATSINFGQTALSNYTEASWTPTITTDATVGTPAYTAQIGRCERVGRQVTLRFSVILSGWTGSPSGNTFLTGFSSGCGTPNTTSNVNGACEIAFYAVTGLAASNFSVKARIDANTTLITLGQNSATGISSLTAAQAGSTPIFVGMCNYQV